MFIGVIFKGYDFKVVKVVGYDYDFEKVCCLLVEVGYLGGKGFGFVNLCFNIGDIYFVVVEEVFE